MSVLRARVTPRAARTSDVDRVADAALATGAAGVVLFVGLAVTAATAHGRGELASPGPLAASHAVAEVACASCHAPSTSAAPSRPMCAGCHDTSSHASTRGAHRALDSRGELACPTCHAAHDGAQGVTFSGAADGAFVRWSNGRTRSGRLPSAEAVASAAAGASVPLVPMAACARCHALGDPRDPAAACAIATARADGHAVSGCFDEHRRVDDVVRRATTTTTTTTATTTTTTTTGPDRCEAQHSPARFVAWDAARAVVPQSTWVSPAWSTSALVRAFLPAGAALVAFAATLVVAPRRRRARQVPSGLTAPPAVAPPARVRLPQINATTCVGCYACVDVCPFDVLEVRAFVAVVVRPKECCGVVSCAQVCPNGSLQIAEGAAVETHLRLDEHLESLDAKGVFVAGDLSGLPLIKNAIRQGARAVDRIHTTLAAADRTLRQAPATTTPSSRVDIAIVGAGPAGISAALAAEARGLSYVVFEQSTVAASIKSFPRDKLVFDQPIDLPLEGELWLRESTKEDLLAQWSRIVRARKLRIFEHHRVDAIERSRAGTFRVSAVGEDGARVVAEASRLVLAIGKRGSPRTLDVSLAPDAQSKVSYALADARSFAGKRVLVVGLGDVAMEAAIALARQPGTEVTVSYRGSELARGKARNIGEMRSLEASGRVRILWESLPTRITRTSVTLSTRAASPAHTKSATLTIANDAVFVLIGGVPSWELVARAGVRLASEVRLPEEIS